MSKNNIFCVCEFYVNNDERLQINGDDSDIFSVRLEDILNCYDRNEGNVFWGLLWVSVTTVREADCDIVKFGEEINTSKRGKLISLDSMLNLSSRIDQAIELLVIGDSNIENIRKYKDDQLMYATCEYVLELMDSSYWIVYSSNSVFLDNIVERILGVEYLN